MDLADVGRGVVYWQKPTGLPARCNVLAMIQVEYIRATRFTLWDMVWDTLAEQAV